MFASTQTHRNRSRRGIVLVLILAMLGLMALIGVTFATFAGQSQIGARSFARAFDQPNSEQLMDFALAQLINDTSNPNSAMRGHSLLRDMYGSDSLHRNGTNNSQVNAYIDRYALGSNTFTLQFQAAQPYTGLGVPLIQYRTNIPSGYSVPSLYGLDFTRWMLRLSTATSPPQFVDQTFEVLEDIVGFVPTFGSAGTDFGLDATNNKMHVFTLSPDSNLLVDLTDGIQLASTPTTNYNHPFPGTDKSANNPISSGRNNYGNNYPSVPPILPIPATYNTTPLPIFPAPSVFPPGAFGNATSSPIVNSAGTFTLDGRYMRAFNGAGISALSHTKPAVSAFTSVAGNATEVIAGLYPNFAKNGGLLAPLGNGNISSIGNPEYLGLGMDEDYDACDLENWFLAIQSADSKIMVPSFHRPGILRANDWRSKAPDSAARFLRPRQVDHPQSNFKDLTPDATGHITYDIDNDGDGITDSVWLDLGYPTQRDASGKLYKPLFAFMVIGLNGRMPLNTVGNLQARDLNTYTSDSTYTTIAIPPHMPMWDHTSSHGYSPSEINPKYALQQSVSLPQLDNVGMPIWLTQLRNLLAGTRAHIDPYTPIAVQNGDMNFIDITGNGQLLYMPNGIADSGDLAFPVSRSTDPVAGRWGEGDYVPQFLYDVFNLASPPVPSIRYTQTNVGGLTVQVSGTGATTPLLNYPAYYLNWTNPIRAGKSPQYINPTGYSNDNFLNHGDSTDDNYTAYDFYPSYNVSSGLTISHPEMFDMIDSAGGVMLPSERMRRFVTPIDLAGLGKVVSYDRPATAGDPFGIGADGHGRVNFFRYFRPPGTAGPVSGLTGWVDPPQFINTVSNTLVNTLAKPLVNTMHGYDAYRLPYSAQPWAMFGGMPYDQFNLNTDANQTAFPPAPLLTAGTNHMTAGPFTPAPIAVVPSPAIDPSFSPVGGNLIVKANTSPTFAEIRNLGTYPSTSTWYVRNQFPLGSIGRDEADEMNVYGPTQTDAPFGPADLEWLYRSQDVDGATLTSRLEKLAPVSFTNPIDGLARRRMFSIDTFDTNNAVFANDNPVSNFTGTVGTAAFPNNSRGLVGNNMSLAYYLSGGIGSGTTSGPVSTPTIAQRDKKINLNFPLPVSNNPDEPVRHKWIIDSYNLLKQILPPMAVDTPEELAELSQYLVNVIDFRDTDGASTHFVNPDVVTKLGSPTEPPRVILKANMVAQTYTIQYVPLEQFGMEYSPIAITEVLAFQFNYKDPTGTLSPPDLNVPYPRLSIEVVNTLMAADGQTRSTDLDMRGWEFLILPDGPFGRPDPVTGQVPQTILNNPNNFTATFGKAFTPQAVPVAYKGPHQTAPLVPTLADWAKPIDNTGHLSLAHSVPALGSGRKTAVSPILLPGDPPADDSRYYYVFSNDKPKAIRDFPTTAFEKNYIDPDAYLEFTADDYDSVKKAPKNDSTPRTVPAGSAGTYNSLVRQLLPIDNSTPPGTTALAGDVKRRFLEQGESRMMWLYLLRPANPFDPTSRKVVVDSIRFPFSEGGGKGGTNTSNSPPDAYTTSPGQDPNGTNTKKLNSTASVNTINDIWSVSRLQPYRGGHLLDPRDPGIDPTLNITTATPPSPTPPTSVASPANAYGYSEQTVPSAGGGGSSTVQGLYGTTGTNVATTRPIQTNIGGPARARGLSNDLTWDYFAFNDRDFQSPAELLLVPNCPPGLFTKQFVENPPPDYVLGAALNTVRVYDPNTKTSTPANPNIGVPFSTSADLPMTTATLTATSVNEIPSTYPYLSDKFFYTAKSPTLPANLPANRPGHPGGTRNLQSDVTGAGTIDGYTSAGWHKMFDFFEIPSPAIGSIGTVAEGVNFDWARRDVKPGLLNINLIVDQEVFLGLFDDQRLDMESVQNLVNHPVMVTQVRTDGYPDIVDYGTGQVYSQLDPINLQGASPPIAAQSMMGGYHVGSNGFHYPNFDDANYLNYPAFRGISGAFSDFLKLRHGGSGFLFAFGKGVVGSGAAPFATPGSAPATYFNPYTNYPTPATSISAGVVANAYPAAERPFHSYSYPDINYTILRPSTLPPVPGINLGGALGFYNFTNPPVNDWNSISELATIGPMPLAAIPTEASQPMASPSRYYSDDPGIKNPFFNQGILPPAIAGGPFPAPPLVGTTIPIVPITDQVFASPNFGYYDTDPPKAASPPAPSGDNLFPQPPAIPYRRLFAIPDVIQARPILVKFPANRPALYSSNAGQGYADATAFINPHGFGLERGQVELNVPVMHPNLNNVFGGIVKAGEPLVPVTIVPPVAAAADTGVNPRFLGANNYFTGTPTALPDQRANTYFRTEMLQKVMNLTTVRTHQFAVWITVGLFEVPHVGDPSFFNAINGLYQPQPDILGAEVGLAAGRSVRYRSFFIIDRTKATGFNPQNPTDFRQVVSYRRRIE